MAETLRLDTDLVEAREPLVARYLTMLADCRLQTIASIKDLRYDLLYWRRNDFDNSISDLLYHISYIEADWLFTDVLEGSIPPELTQQLRFKDRDSKGRLIHVGEEQLEHSLLRLQRVRERLNRAYSPMDLAEFRRLRRRERHDISPEWVLNHLVQHEAEHRGQINLLKRLGAERRTRAQ
jgi:uncharacterized damage-inducible protein DinB